MKEYKNERPVSAVAALLLFAVFAVGVLCVLLTGAQGYRRLNAREEAAYNSRICAQYLATKLRQAENAGAVDTAAFGDADALQIIQTVEEEVYITRIYCYDGWLMELFTLDGGEFSPEDGERVLPASNLSVSRQEQLLLICITDGSGRQLQLQHALQGWEEVP